MAADSPFAAFARGLAERRMLLAQRNEILLQARELRSSTVVLRVEVQDTVFRARALLAECADLRKQVAAARLLLRPDQDALDRVERDHRVEVFLARRRA